MVEKEAVRLARITGKPVQVVYSRQEEFFSDRFHPAVVMKIRAGVAAGKIVLWDSQVFEAGDREGNPFYDIPHKRVASAGGWQAFGEQQYLRARIAHRRPGGAG